MTSETVIVAAKPSQRRAVVTRNKILVNSAYLFDQDGYAATSLDGICVAGITKGAVYYHFASKDEIAAALIGEWVDAAATAYELTAVTHDDLTDLLAFVEVLADNAANHTKLRAGLKLTLDRQVTSSTDGYSAWTRLLRKRVRAAVEAGLLTDTSDHYTRNSLSAVLVGLLLAPEPLNTLPERVVDTTRALLRGLKS